MPSFLQQGQNTLAMPSALQCVSQQDPERVAEIPAATGLADRACVRTSGLAFRQKAKSHGRGTWRMTRNLNKSTGFPCKWFS